MTRGSMAIIVVLCITTAGISKVYALQSPQGNNPNIARIQQLKQEMQGLQKQAIPLYAQIQQLMNQIKELKEQIRPLEETMKADTQKIQSLVGTNAKK